MNQQKIDLLASSLRALGVTIDVPVLDLIFTLYNKIEEKDSDITLADIHKLSEEVSTKYNIKDLK